MTTKKLHSFKFHDSDYEIWKKYAEQKGITITKLIERVMAKHHTDKKLFK